MIKYDGKKYLLWICHFCREFIEHIKIIRDATPNQYMALIKFKNQVQIIKIISHNLQWFLQIPIPCEIMSALNMELQFLLLGISRRVLQHL